MSNQLKALRPVMNQEIPDVLKFSYEEIALAMLKARGVAVGFWELGFAFGQQAMKISDERTGKTLPACMNYISEIHLVRVPAINSMAVDATKSGIIVVGSI